MRTLSQGDPPSAVDEKTEHPKVDWEGFFNPLEYDEKERLFIQELMTAPFDFEFGGVKLVPLAEDGSVFGTPDHQHTYTREQISMALEMRLKLLRLAHGEGWQITDDIDSLLELYVQPNLCVEHRERFITDEDLAQPTDGASEAIAKIVEYVIRDFREGTLPTRASTDYWMRQANDELGEFRFARREIRRISDGIEAVLEAQYERERRDGSSPASDEIAVADENLGHDMLKRLVDLSLVGGRREGAADGAAKKDPKDLKN